MTVSPYLTFNGNCAEAIALYENAFGVKAKIMRYKDAPPSEGYQPPVGTEDYVMHAQFNIGNDAIMFCDTTPEMKTGFGSGMAIHVGLSDIESVKKAFDILKEGGKVGMELQETFWNKRFGSLEDKFGVNWMISLDS